MAAKQVILFETPRNLRRNLHVSLMKFRKYDVV